MIYDQLIHRKRLPLLTFRAGMLLATLMGSPLQYLAYHMIGAQYEKESVAHLEEMGALVEFDYDGKAGATSGPLTPAWAKPIVGAHLFDKIAMVKLSPKCSGQLQCLAALAYCESVIAYRVPLSKDDVRQIGRMRSLRTLDLSSSRITDAELCELNTARNLESLTLDQNPITGAGLAPIQDIPLTSISLVDTNLDDRGAEILSKMVSLRRLFITSDRLTEKGLLALGSVKTLEDVIIACPGATDATIAELRKRLPRATIRVPKAK